MKRLTEEQVLMAQRHASRIARRQTRKKRGGRRKIQPIRVFSRISIQAPDVLDLFNQENYQNFIEFITRLRDCVESGQKALIDFRNTESLKACAVVVLYAYIDLLQRQALNKKVIAITKCKTPRANNWFKICGLWELTGFYNANLHKLDSLAITSAVAGKPKNNKDSLEARQKIKSVLKYIKDTIYGGKISPTEGQKLYAALTESISNVGLHAYSDANAFSEFIDEIGKRWWILAHKIEDQLFLMVYDMGHGIPITLVKKNFYTLLVQKFAPKTDSDKIFAAVQYGESRMTDEKHGKGLTDMKSYVVDNPKGELHIFSGMGRYTYNSQKNTEEKYNLPYSIGGTLIQWNVSLGGEDDR